MNSAIEYKFEQFDQIKEGAGGGGFESDIELSWVFKDFGILGNQNHAELSKMEGA